jgi:hypothetical protein
VADVTDPCHLCAAEIARRAVNERAREERMRVRIALERRT